jgi:hypothetical protein
MTTGRARRRDRLELRRPDRASDRPGTQLGRTRLVTRFLAGDAFSHAYTQGRGRTAAAEAHPYLRAKGGRFAPAGLSSA